MRDKGRANHFFIALGIVAIGVSAFVGLFSTVAYLGILAGAFLIWAAFPEKAPETVEVIEEQLAPSASQTDIGIRSERD